MFFSDKTNNHCFNNTGIVGNPPKHGAMGFLGNELIKTKPPMTYRAMIGLAILSAPQQKLTLSEIYRVIERNFPVFTSTRSGWKNTVRHNLSLHECFVKGREITQRRGCYWRLHARYEESIRREAASEKFQALKSLAEESYSHYDEIASQARATNTYHRERHDWSIQPYQAQEFTATYRVQQTIKSDPTPCCCHPWNGDQRHLAIPGLEFSMPYDASSDGCYNYSTYQHS